MLRRRLLLLAAVLVCLVGSVPVYAETLASPSYKFEESTLGADGLMDSSSSQYQARGAGGEAAVGDMASDSYQASAGSQTTADPSLSFAINESNVSFDDFSPAAASMTTSTFTVANHTSYGYVVQILGQPPSKGGHTIPAMSESGPSETGKEQFGINLVANTLPKSIGKNPDLGLFGAGQAAPNYNNANTYRYASGETIALAPKSSGETTYTISYMVNVSSITPGGKYTGNQVLVCTGTF